VVLAPNQRVVYNDQTKEFAIALVENPVPVCNDCGENENPPHINFNYNETSLKTVFAEMEKTYQIAIVLEDSKSYNCTFTGDLTDQDMYTQLDFVCKSVGATYEIMDTTIMILGVDCQ
jgi:transmembrane sensor